MAAVAGERSLDSRGVAVAADRWILRLFCVWVFLQCFHYVALPSLRLDLGVSMTPDRIALAAMLLLFTVRYATAERRSLSGLAAAVERLLLVFGTIGLISWWIAAPDAHLASYSNLTQLLNIAFLPALSYMVAARLNYTESMLRTVLFFLVAFGLYLSVTAFGERYDFSALVFPKYILDPSIGIHAGRSRGPFVDTIGNGGTMAFAFAAGSCLAATYKGVRQIAALPALLTIIIGVYFTDTRGVWLALAATLATLLVFRTSMRRVSLWIVCVLVFAFLLGVGSKFSISQPTLFSRRQNTVDNRLDNFAIAWNAFKANPTLGLGYGRFRTDWPKYYDKMESRLGIGMDDGNHSTILGLLADIGLVGTLPLTLAVACAALLCRRSYGHLKAQTNPLPAQVALVGLAAIGIWVVLSLTNDLRSQPGITVPAFWLVGVAGSLHASRGMMRPSGGSRRSIAPRYAGFAGAAVKAARTDWARLARSKKAPATSRRHWVTG